MTINDHPARVRFAPSPTGFLHLGGARTALFDYLLAKKTGGQFILRIEDTDRKRLVQGAEEDLMNSLRWLGIEWDEGPDIGGPFGPYRQSERKEIYQKFAVQLVEEGKAFYCFCTPEQLSHVREEQQKNKISPHYNGACRSLPTEEVRERIREGESHVIRFKMPEKGTTTVNDLLRGEITFENRTLDDYILVKSDGWALYHLAAAVDDHLMKITHVIRGSEWLPTFPLHSLIHKALGWDEPVWVHLSVFLKPSGKGKMSKRETGDLIKDGYSIFIKDLEGLGYLPEAVINWIALMGWSYDDHTEIFPMDELIQKFSLEKLNPSPAAINFTKLDYFNGLHIRGLSDADLASRIQPFYSQFGLDPKPDILEAISPIIRERLVTLDDSPGLTGFFFKDIITMEKDDLTGKGLDAKSSSDIAQQSHNIITKLPSLNAQTVEPALRALVEELGLTPGQVFGILRAAVTGQKVSPPLFESMEILGKEKVLSRIQKAISVLRNSEN